MGAERWTEERDIVPLQCAARRLGWLRLAALVADTYGVSEQALLGRDRSQRATEARQLLYLVLYEYLAWSVGAIARTIGRDDSSVSHGLAKMRRALGTREVAYTLVCIDEEIVRHAGRLPPRRLEVAS